MRSFRHPGLWLIPGLLWSIWLGYASLAHMPESIPLPSDTLMHVSAYLVLVYLYGCCFAPRKLPLLILAAAGLGLAMECLQGMTTYRSFEWADALANLTGAVLGGGLAATRAGQLFQRLEGKHNEPA